MQTRLFTQPTGDALTAGFEEAVERYYRPLYQFALSLTHSEADACDLTQHTFYTLKLKGNQLREVSKVKAWMFTTLHRAFLQSRRKEVRFPHYELEAVDSELPSIQFQAERVHDSAEALEALAYVDELFRAPLSLFYFEDCSYQEIAEILRVPLGTVKSRISRGIIQLQKILMPENCGRQRVAA